MADLGERLVNDYSFVGTQCGQAPRNGILFGGQCPGCWMILRNARDYKRKPGKVPKRIRHRVDRALPKLPVMVNARQFAESLYSQTLYRKLSWPCPICNRAVRRMPYVRNMRRKKTAAPVPVVVPPAVLSGPIIQCATPCFMDERGDTEGGDGVNKVLHLGDPTFAELDPDRVEILYQNGAEWERPARAPTRFPILPDPVVV